jgi:hypothetical protein
MFLKKKSPLLVGEKTMPSGIVSWAVDTGLQMWRGSGEGDHCMTLTFYWD